MTQTWESVRLEQAAQSLLKREQPTLVAATAIFFLALQKQGISKTLEEVLEFSRGGIWGEEVTPNLGFPVLRSTNTRGMRVSTAEPAWCSVPQDIANKVALRTGDILVTKASGSSDLVGKSALFIQPDDNRQYLFSNFMLGLRPNQAVVDPEFLAWFLRSPQALSWRFESQQTTVGLRNLQTKPFLQQRIPLPELQTQKAIANSLNALENSNAEWKKLLPDFLEEQKRIVAIVENLAAQIAEARGLREVITKAQNVYQSVLLSGLIEKASPREKWVRLATVVASIQNGWSPACESRRVNGEEWGVLKVGAVSYGKYNDLENKALPFSLKPKPEYEVKVGDFIMSRANTVQLVGACALVYATRNRLMLSDKLFRFTFFDDLQTNPEYLDLVLKSPQLREQIEKAASGTSPTMKNISKEKVMNLLIPHPTFEQQQRIIDLWHSSQQHLLTLEKLQEATRLELNALLPSVLSKAFAGEL